MHLLQNIQLGGPERLTEADDQRQASKENGGPADFWYLDDAISCATFTLVLPYFVDFDTANAPMGAERTRQHHPSGCGGTTTMHCGPTLGHRGGRSSQCPNAFSFARQSLP